MAANEAAAPSVPGQVESPSSASAVNGHNGVTAPANAAPASKHAVDGVEQQQQLDEQRSLKDSSAFDRVTPVLQAMGASVLAPLASHSVVVRPEDARTPPPVGPDGQADMWWFYQPWASARTVTQFVSALLLIWVFQFLYLGATWDPVQKMGGLPIAVLNCDAGVNSTVVQAMPAQLQPYSSQLIAVPLATQLLSATVYNGSSPASGVLYWQAWACNGSLAGCGTAQQEAACYADLQEEILQGRQWAAWYWPSNTSLAHLSSFNVTGNAAALLAPPAQPVVLYQVYARGRNYSTYSYILLLMQSVAVAITQAFGLTIARSGVVTAGLFFPTSLVPPITVKLVDLAPVTYFGQNMACYVCCLLTWLGSAFCVALSSQHKMVVEMQALNATTPEKRPPFRKVFWALSLKASAGWLFMFTLSSLLVLCVMALGTAAGDGAQFDRNPGVAIAFLWWLSFTYMAVNGLLLHALGIERFNSVSALLLILQLMSSGGILSEETSPGFYYVGRALPFYYGVRGLRTIFFGTQADSMYANWLVLFGWNVGTSLVSWVFVAHKIHNSGATARPRMAPMGTVGDVALAAGI